MGAEVTILANPYTYNFLKGLTHSAVQPRPPAHPLGGPHHGLGRQLLGRLRRAQWVLDSCTMCTV